MTEKVELVTFESVLANLHRQLDWVGPTGRQMGHIVFDRREGAVLLKALEAIKDCDDGGPCANYVLGA